MSVRISSHLDTKAASDVYATHLGNLTKGGVHTKDSIAQMNSIPVERRSRMMLCVVADTGGGSPALYWLNTPINPTQAQLADNQYWEIVPLGVTIDGVLSLLGFQDATALTILDSVGTLGDTYIVETGGSVNDPNIFGGEAVTLNVGDYLVYQGSQWNQVPTGATAVTWATLPGKPTTFTPTSHQHVIADITDFPDLSGYQLKSEVVTVIDGTNPLYLATQQAIIDYVAAQLSSNLANYYTSTQIDNTFTSYYTKTQTDALIDAIEGYVLYVSESLTQLAIDVPNPAEGDFAYIQGEFSMYRYESAVWVFKYNTSLPADNEAYWLNSDVNNITELKTKGTVALTINDYTIFKNTSDNDKLYIYKLESGTDAEALPNIVRPNDYAPGTNEKVWKRALFEWKTNFTALDTNEIQNLASGDISAQTGTTTFSALEWDITTVGRTSSGDANFFNFKKDTVVKYRLDVDGNIYIDGEVKDIAGTNKYSPVLTNGSGTTISGNSVNWTGTLTSNVNINGDAINQYAIDFNNFGYFSITDTLGNGIGLIGQNGGIIDIQTSKDGNPGGTIKLSSGNNLLANLAQGGEVSLESLFGSDTGTAHTKVASLYNRTFIEYENTSGGIAKIDINPTVTNGILITDSVHTKGLVGAADYSSNYDNNTYIQKIYADSSYWTLDATSGDASLVQNTVTSDISAQTGTKTFTGVDYDITSTGRTSTGDALFLNFKKDTVSKFEIDLNGNTTVIGSLITSAGATQSAIVFGGYTADPSDGAEGYTYYNSSTKKIRFHDGTSWANVDGNVDHPLMFNVDSDSPVSDWASFQGHIEVDTASEILDGSVDDTDYITSLDGGATEVTHSSLSALDTWIDANVTLSTTKFLLKVSADTGTNIGPGTVAIKYKIQ